jgi:hypothetical protein
MTARSRWAMLNLNSLIIPCSEGIWNPTRALAASPCFEGEP